MSKVLCLGDACVDIIIPYDKDKESFFVCGGSSSNSAFGLAKLGVDVAFAGKAGNDEYGKAMKQELQSVGVNVDSFILDDKLPSTQIRVEFDEQNDRHPYLVNKDSPSYLQIYKSDLEKIDISDTEYILSNGMMLFENPAAENISEYLVACHNKGIKILLDINYRVETIDKNKVYLNKVLGIADYLLGSVDDDFLPLTGSRHIDDAVKILLRDNVLVTRNSLGSTVHTKENTYHADSYKVDVVDTLGAGDAHNTGFVYGLVNNYSLPACNDIACKVAANCISKTGARNIFI